MIYRFKDKRAFEMISLIKYFKIKNRFYWSY